MKNTKSVYLVQVIIYKINIHSLLFYWFQVFYHHFDRSPSVDLGSVCVSLCDNCVSFSRSFNNIRRAKYP